ncbi:uncharacterized protein FIBRA_05344 [Fibroporia radiculosa]|uniref:Amidohydrolase 3 domain-containing protein n=1 Tax=Fibroporia radiculosa TaxID=599839 RepID=J4GQT9_9APHY|nr:uncharacterized protein FIBRA_05344 [Fibroporia radiculosa]CCM03220.1 predicted protein [Fibroporia radiculosa]
MGNPNDTLPKLSAPESSSTAGSTPATKQNRVQETLRHVLFVLVASVLAGLATYASRKSAYKRAYLTSLPESYALCAEHGKIYTVDEDRLNVDCILVKGDTIQATGSMDELHTYWDMYQNELVNKFYGGESKAKKPLTIVNTSMGSIVVPGLADAHAHLMLYGEKMQLNLEGAETIEDVLDRIEDYAASHPTASDDSEHWITGFGWDQTRWKDWKGGFPTKDDLESRALLANRSLALSRVDGHALWVSTRALELTMANIPGGSWPDVEGGEVVTDEKGDPTGVFLDAAMSLVPVPPPTQDEMEEHLEWAINDVLAVGLTSVHDAAVSIEMLKVFKRMAEEGRLKIRVYAMAHEGEAEYWGSRFEKLEDYGEDGKLNLQSVKLFTDGALGSWGAALLEPYSDKPETCGLMRSTEEALRETMSRFWNDGWGVNIHCIGDRANKAVLDIFEDLIQDNVSHNRRPRIEHAQIMQLEDLGRAGRLGVITSVQPTHATSDMWYAESRLGPSRIKGAYAYQTFLRSSRDNVLPLGSDFPVEGINPLLTFYAAVSRLDVEGNSPHGSGGWYPSESLSRAQALKGMTYDAAYASFAEEKLGSLTAGKKADFVVLDKDFMQLETPLADILTTKVMATVIGGQIMYGGV